MAGGLVTNSPLSGSKQVRVKSFTISRTDTAAALKTQLPQQAVILGFILNGTVSANPLTSAAIKIGSSVAATEYVATYDVKTNGASAALLPAVGGLGTVVLGNSTPIASDQKIYAIYAEVGTASTVGGPWTIDVLYVV